MTEAGAPTLKPNREEIQGVIEQLPDILSDAYSKARGGWGGTTADMRSATADVIEVAKRIWLRLARLFPEDHFGMPPDDYLNIYVDHRAAWHRALAEPHGLGTGGTIAPLLTAGGVLRDIEAASVEMVRALTHQYLLQSAEQDRAWLQRWEAAKRARPETSGAAGVTARERASE